MRILRCICITIKDVTCLNPSLVQDVRGSYKGSLTNKAKSAVTFINSCLINKHPRVQGQSIQEVSFFSLISVFFLLSPPSITFLFFFDPKKNIFSSYLHLLLLPVLLLLPPSLTFLFLSASPFICFSPLLTTLSYPLLSLLPALSSLYLLCLPLAAASSLPCSFILFLRPYKTHIIIFLL